MADQKLKRRLVSKALNVPEGELDLNQRTTTTTNGFGWKEMAVLAATGLAGYGLLAPDPAAQQAPVFIGPPVAAAPIAAAVQPVASLPPATIEDDRYNVEVQIRDAASGQPIHVDWVKPR